MMTEWLTYPENKPKQSLCWVTIENRKASIIDLACFVGRYFYCVYDNARLENVIAFTPIERPQEPYCLENKE